MLEFNPRNQRCVEKLGSVSHCVDAALGLLLGSGKHHGFPKFRSSESGTVVSDSAAPPSPDLKVRS